MASPAITDDLLAEIFLRLPTPADLVRASAACVSFSRLVTDRSFLWRFRSLHSPPFLGFLDHNGFHPALPPHPSSPAARAISLAADFSFSFLPSLGRWIVRDVRDGRVLLDCAPEDGTREGPLVFTELAVCDPLHRRYLLLPPIPDDLAALVERPLRVEFERWCEPFLVPPGEEEAAAAVEETSFRVIWMAQCKAKLVAFVFTSSSGQWRAVASRGLSDLVVGVGVGVPSRGPVFFGRQYACGFFYWVMDWRGKLLVLDTRRMQFSIADLPPSCPRRNIAIVDAGEGRPGMFSLRDNVADGTVDLCYTIRRSEGESSNQWQMEKTIPLDSGYHHHIRGATERFLLLLRIPQDQYIGLSLEVPEVHLSEVECISLDVRTLHLDRVCALKHHIPCAHIYTNFPPSLSSQII